jgi:hypothetical protein
MPLWDAPYLLGQFNRLAGRPQADQVTDATKYLWLSEGQNEVVADIAARQPEVLYPVSAQLMSTVDGGHTFTFGTYSDGTPVFPMGKVNIYKSVTAVPGYMLMPGVDYLEEGNRIEIPNNRTYAGSLYWRGITAPQDINATTPPVLQPPPSRSLITMCAVKNFAQAGNINPDLAAQMAEQWSREFPRWMLVYRTQFTGGGVLGPLVSNPVLGPYNFAANLPGTSAL